ncbi:MAG: hypothetical protein AAB693_01260, partial [Patescibacteria group bacterium]
MLIERSNKNPILKPKKSQTWEAVAVFNGCPVKKGNKIYLLYRALSLPHYHANAETKLMVSNIGVAESKDGINFSNREPIIVPELPWEKFGCEDPRVTKFGNKYFIFYTAISVWPPRAEGIRVGLAISKNLKSIQEKHLVTPFNAKAMALFPEKINGKIYAILTVNTDLPPSKICLATFNKESDIWSEAKWKKWYQNFEKNVLTLEKHQGEQIEVGSPPIKTKYGWLLFYANIKNYFSQKPIFAIEAVLLDLKDPFKIIGRTKNPLLTPEEYYEKIGLVPDVIFPSGAILKKNSIDLYYGATDMTCCLATINSSLFFKKLLDNKKNINLIRAKENPIISPIKENVWESKATLNPAAIYLNDKVHIIYRAQAEDNTSVFGYAQSFNGISIDYRSSQPIYVARESFEKKLTPGGNSGVEDPRITKIGNKIYMLYTAFDGKNPPRIALTWIKEKDFLN